jgi:hypothetical protein
LFYLSACPPVHPSAPEFQLPLRFHQPVQRERDCPYRQALGVGQHKGPAGGVPELRVEHCRSERHGASTGGIVGVGRFHPKPSRGESALAEPPAEPLAQQAEQGMENADIVGVGGQGMRDVKLGLPLRGQHRPGIDALGPRSKRAALTAEDGAERTLGNGGNLANEIELIIFQPRPYAGAKLG